MINSVHYEILDVPNPFQFYLKALGPRPGIKDGDKIPPISVTWPEFSFDEKLIRSFVDICQLPPAAAKGVPLFFPHSYFGPLHLKILTDSSFPLKILGSVHLRNTVIQNSPLQLNTKYGLKIELTDQRRRPQGLEVDFTTSVTLNGKLQWQSLTCFLIRKKFEEHDQESQQAQILQNLAKPEKIGSFPVPENIGKRFGWLTKDINPIHMSRVLAKLFGFKRDICHGMWALNRSLAYAENLDFEAPIRNDVAFKGPLYIGKEVSVKSDSANANTIELYSGKNDRPCVLSQTRNVAKEAFLD